MVDTNELKGIMAKRGKSGKEVAEACGITPKTFYLKMKAGVFGSDEMESMIDYLDIENPAAIFFAKDVT